MENILIVMVGVPTIIFMLIVAPIWLILHYRSKKQVSQGLTEDEYGSLQGLSNKAEAMAERIQTLEAILDAEAPEWRNKA